MGRPIDYASRIAEPESAEGALMAELFQSIGFEVVDEDSYNRLADYAETSGQRSIMQRGEATLHGRCLRVGEGLEVWSVLYEKGESLYYADCRPSYRSRYVHRIQPWELIEYDEDGEAIVRGTSSKGEPILFELQNITEADPSLFREMELSVGLAGIAYSCQILNPDNRKSDDSSRPRLELIRSGHDGSMEVCESDYNLRGTIRALRQFHNPMTRSELVWLYVDAGFIHLELITSRGRIKGRPRIGSTIVGSLWLQGHLLGPSEVGARYEGVDLDSAPADFWSHLRRDT